MSTSPARPTDPLPHQTPDQYPRKRSMGTGAIIAIVVGALILLLGGFCLVGGIFGLLAPALAKARATAIQTVSRSQLSMLGEALSAYAAKHDGRLPGADQDWMAALEMEGLLPREALIPLQVRDVPASPPMYYFYVPAERLSGSSTRILAYEHPDLSSGGGNVLMHDLTAVFLDEPAFTTAIGTLTLEDGTRWAPHEAVDLGLDE